MTPLAAAIATGLGAVPLAAAFWFVRRVRKDIPVPWRLPAGLAVAGLFAGALAFFLERAVFRWTELSIEVSTGTGTSALLALLLFAAPFEEASKVVMVWPTVMRRQLTGPGLGVTFAVSVASGFAAAETVLFLTSAEPSGIRIVRALAGLPAHAFCAGLWGYALGDRVRGGRWFAPAWLGAVLVHAFYDHIVFGRGPGYLAAAAPMLVAMTLITWSALRDIAPSVEVVPASFPIHLPEPPSLRAVRRVLRSRDQPLLVRWIAFGALVNVGTVIACLALGVFVAHRFGIDLALADEADMRSNGPLALLGVAVLSAFPIAGFLVARASGAHTVLEPAFAAGLAIAGAVALLSVTAPTAVIFALAIAPIAFGLACGGAWFGMDT